MELKLYFATDSTPADKVTHELCMEYIDFHWEMDQIYGRVMSSFASCQILADQCHAAPKLISPKKRKAGQTLSDMRAVMAHSSGRSH